MTLRFKYPSGIYLLKVHNKNTRAGCGICAKLIIKILGVFNVNFERIYFRHCSSVSINSFEHVQEV